jgi:hypothetical protein
MAKLINTVDDLKKHIVLSASFDFKKVLPYAKRAERKIMINLIGREQYDAIVEHAYDEESDEPINEVRHLFEEAVSYYAMFLAFPTLNILITNSGAKQLDNSESTPATWSDKLDINRSLVKTYTEALDDAFEIMESNPEDFTEWSDSDYYTIFKDLIVSQTKDFNKFFNIQNNRYTFIALKPMMREVESQYLVSMLGQCTLDFLKEKSADDIVLKAQEIATQAVVALTVAKTAENGAFSFTEASMTYNMDQLPWEKKNQLSDEKIDRLMKARQTAGEEYLKQLKKFIVANTEKFTCYEDKTELGLDAKIIRKKSGLFL